MSKKKDNSMSNANEMARREHFRAEKRVASRHAFVKTSEKVYLLEEDAGGISEFDIPEDQMVGSTPQQQLTNASHFINRKLSGELFSTIGEVIEIGGNQIGVGSYGHMSALLLRGPTAGEMAQHIWDLFVEEDMNFEEAIQNIMGED